MRLMILLALPLLAVPAMAQAPVAGAVVDRFELIDNRTVFFEETADGKLKILRVVDNSRSLPIPKTPGQVGVAMTFAQEIGTVIEFNSGLDHAFTYTANVVTPGEGGEVLKPLPVCPVGKALVASEQWPAPYARIVLGDFRRLDGKADC